VESTLQELSCEGVTMKPFNFKMEEVEGFRYRAKDALKAVTRIAVREARLKEIRLEIMNSQKLKVKMVIKEKVKPSFCQILYSKGYHNFDFRDISKTTQKRCKHYVMTRLCEQLNSNHT